MHGVLILTDKSASYRIVDAAETNKDGSGVTTGENAVSKAPRGLSD